MPFRVRHHALTAAKVAAVALAISTAIYAIKNSRLQPVVVSESTPGDVQYSFKPESQFKVTNHHYRHHAFDEKKIQAILERLQTLEPVPEEKDEDFVTTTDESFESVLIFPDETTTPSTTESGELDPDYVEKQLQKDLDEILSTVSTSEEDSYIVDTAEQLDSKLEVLPENEEKPNFGVAEKFVRERESLENEIPDIANQEIKIDTPYEDAESRKDVHSQNDIITGVWKWRNDVQLPENEENPNFDLAEKFVRKRESLENEIPDSANQEIKIDTPYQDAESRKDVHSQNDIITGVWKWRNDVQLPENEENPNFDLAEKFVRKRESLENEIPDSANQEIKIDTPYEDAESRKDVHSQNDIITGEIPDSINQEPKIDTPPYQEVSPQQDADTSEISSQVTNIDTPPYQDVSNQQNDVEKNNDNLEDRNEPVSGEYVALAKLEHVDLKGEENIQHVVHYFDDPVTPVQIPMTPLEESKQIENSDGQNDPNGETVI
eukprot:119057_1